MWLPAIGQAQDLPLLAQDLRNGHLVLGQRVAQQAQNALALLARHEGLLHPTLQTNDVICHHWTRKALEGKLPAHLSGHQGLDGTVDPLGDEDLAPLRRVAQTGGEVRDCANRRIIETPLKANLAEGCIAQGAKSSW